MDWDLQPGDRVRRTDLHARYGGGGQGGIAPSAQTPNVLIFSEARSGEQHGYFDHWEGSVFHYAGEGQRGDQTMDVGNGAILNHAEAGRALRVFKGVGGEVTYVGEFGLDPTEPWYWDTAPETGGGPLRKVIKFKLVPAGDFFEAGQRRSAGDLTPGLDGSYREAEEDPQTEQREPFDVDPDTVDRALAAHAATQNALAQFIESHGLRPISPELGDPSFDVGWWAGDTFDVAEVKSLSERNERGQLRLGLGQVLDYADVIRRSGRDARAVLAVEREPVDGRWSDLCAGHGVRLVWPGVFDRLID